MPRNVSKNGLWTSKIADEVRGNHYEKERSRFLNRINKLERKKMYFDIVGGPFWKKSIDLNWEECKQVFLISKMSTCSHFKYKIAYCSEILSIANKVVFRYNVSKIAAIIYTGKYLFWMFNRKYMYKFNPFIWCCYILYISASVVVFICVRPFLPAPIR